MTLPNFWSTGLAKVLIGEQPCKLEAWLAGRKLMPKRAGVDPTWKLQHTTFLHATRDVLAAAGWRVTVEQFFRLTGKTAVLTGKADLVANAKGRISRIVDCKTGEPKDHHIAQVAIYGLALPKAWGRDILFEGQVMYKDGTHTDVGPEQIQEFDRPLWALIRELATDQRPPANPSDSACRFCDATVDICPDRCETRAEAETEDLF